MPRYLDRCFPILPVLLLVLAFGCAWYTYANRYYFRFIPIPAGSADIVNNDSWLTPNYEPATPLGTLDFGSFDMGTEDGLRKTLNLIQDLSPTANIVGMPSYNKITFAKWILEISTKPFLHRWNPVDCVGCYTAGLES